MQRIAPNDPALAHGAARHSIVELAERVANIERCLIDLPTIKDVARVLRHRYGALLLDENIVRATGSRARASWVVLDVDEDELLPLRIQRWTQGNFVRLVADALPIRIRRHALARLFQRTAGVGDVRVVATILAPHITQACAAIVAGVVAGQRIATESAVGRMVWQAIAQSDGDLILRAMTWLPPDVVQ